MYKMVKPDHISKVIFLGHALVGMDILLHRRKLSHDAPFAPVSGQSSSLLAASCLNSSDTVYDCFDPFFNAN